jgi:chromosome segregation ATPase
LTNAPLPHPRNGDDDDKNRNTVPMANKQFPRDALLGSFSVPNDSDDIAPYVEKDKDEELHQQPPSLLSNHHHKAEHEMNVQSLTSTNSNNNTKVLHRADSGQLPATKHRGSQTRTGKSSLPMISLESFDENDDVDHSNGDSSVSASRNQLESTLTEQKIPSSRADIIQSKEIQNNKQFEAMQVLELKCKELQAKLINAESRIAELQEKEAQSVSNHHHQSTNNEYEALMIQFQEKETRLLQAANEEHQNEIKNVRYEMNQQILALQQQLLDERNAFGKERDQLESKLEEYHDTVEKFQSQSRVDQETTEKTVDQMQQQHLRALRKVEDKLAYTVASLEERDNDTKRYKERIKQLESKLSEQNKGVNEVEEEVNELHNENEILHDHIERLQAEAVELRNTISKLEGDSEKLVHLKVCT